MLKEWRGDIAFSNDMAIFRGQVAGNDAHSHWASQLTIALEGEVGFVTRDGEGSAEAIYFASKTEHQLLSGHICSIYFDPLSPSLFSDYASRAENGWLVLTRDQLPEPLRAITAKTDLQALVASGVLGAPDASLSSDARVRTVVEAIKAAMGDGQDLDRDSLARRVNLSPSRFSHWFVEHTGVPLRSYKKWLKLRLALDALLEGKGPTEAAMLGGFSDLAHMSREFSDSFGLTYMDALRAWQHLQQR